MQASWDARKCFQQDLHKWPQPPDRGRRGAVRIIGAAHPKEQNIHPSILRLWSGASTQKTAKSIAFWSGDFVENKACLPSEISGDGQDDDQYDCERLELFRLIKSFFGWSFSGAVLTAEHNVFLRFRLKMFTNCILQNIRQMGKNKFKLSSARNGD